MKQKSTRSMTSKLKNDLDVATSRAVHDGLPFVQITRVLVQTAGRMAEMMEISHRLDREELARARRTRRRPVSERKK